MADRFDPDFCSDFVPSEPIPVVRLNLETREREFVHLHWGLIPTWVSDPALGTRLTHARSETVATKRAFREVFRRRR
jgi:putative SOS response-associated peptidase YedK